jgi:hypothetical protein
MGIQKVYTKIVKNQSLEEHLKIMKIGIKMEVVCFF